MIGVLACGAAAHGQESGYEGDVTDVRVVRHVERHPQAWRLWQPYIIKSTRKGQLIMQNEFSALTASWWLPRKMINLAERLMALVA